MGEREVGRGAAPNSSCWYQEGRCQKTRLEKHLLKAGCKEPIFGFSGCLPVQSRLVKHRGTGLHIHWVQWKCLQWGLLSWIRLGITRPHIEVSRGLFLWQQICTSQRANTAQSPRWATAVPPSHCPVVHFQNDWRGTSETRAEVINCF